MYVTVFQYVKSSARWCLWAPHSTDTQEPLECFIYVVATSHDLYHVIHVAMGCGHYTAYSYNTLSDQWHYFNDETVSQVSHLILLHNTLMVGYN